MKPVTEASRSHATTALPAVVKRGNCLDGRKNGLHTGEFMSLYDTIMAAADHIERHPNEFLFTAFYIPPRTGCGIPGCALGWIGCMAGLSDDAGSITGISRVAGNPASGRYRETLLGIGQGEFYDRMSELDGHVSDPGGARWTHDAGACARALRLYAQKYHRPDPAVQRLKEALVYLAKKVPIPGRHRDRRGDFRGIEPSSVCELIGRRAVRPPAH
jgi:hypothetical protein